MLDDLKIINSRDKSDALGINRKQWQQYKYNFGFKFQSNTNVSNLVIAGMGGSGLAAKVIVTWPSLSIPVQVVQDYKLPKFVDDNSLLIATSYSGNTEETLSVVNEALTLEKSPKIVVICSGGELENIARQHNLPLVKLPVGYQPRMTFGYQLRALVEILEQFGLVKNQINNLEVAADKLNVILESFAETVPEANNLAKQLALEAMGKSIVMYASSLFSALAYKWKISFNENAKTIAWTNQFPEFNHNEFLGWTSHPVDKPYSVFELRSSFDNPRITKRFEITEQLLSGKKPAAEVINLVGDNLLDQLLYGIALGDFTSIYLAILNNVDPTPVDIIETFKAKMKG